MFYTPAQRYGLCLVSLFSFEEKEIENQEERLEAHRITRVLHFLLQLLHFHSQQLLFTEILGHSVLEGDLGPDRIP